MLTLLLACAPDPVLKSAQRAEIEAGVVAAASLRAQAATARNAAMSLAESVVASDRPCPIKVPQPASMGGPASFNDMSNALAALAGANLYNTRLETLYGTANLGKAGGPLLRTLDQTEADVRASLADPEAIRQDRDVTELVRKVKTLGYLDYDITVLGRTLQSALAVDDQTFAPGSMSARVLVYDYREKRVECIADVVASSSASIRVVRLAQGGVPLPSMLSDATSLGQDLVNEATRAGIADLHAVQFPAPPVAVPGP